MSYLDSMILGAKAQGWRVRRVPVSHVGGAICHKASEPAMILIGGDSPCALIARNKSAREAMLALARAISANDASARQIERFRDSQQDAENEWGSGICGGLIAASRAGR